MIEPITRAKVEGRDNIIVQAIGSGINVAVNARIPHLRLTQFVDRTQNILRDSSDAALLSEYRDDVLPLIGREATMAELDRWIGGDQRILVRVLIGAGGRGKTRIALELARRTTKHGWMAGFVGPGELSRFRKKQSVTEWAWDKPTLIVVDDAASQVEHLRDWLGELVNAPSTPTQPPLRMLLLERQANREIGWFASVFGHGQDDQSRAAQSLLDPPEPLELPPVDDIAKRRQIFATMLARRTTEMTAPGLGSDPTFDRLLQHEKWSGDPLFLMMAGLIAASAGINGALRLTRTDLATLIARRELDRIGAIATSLGIDPASRHPGFIALHLAVLATLSQGLALSNVHELIGEELTALKSSAQAIAIVEALQDALPRIGDGREIGPIVPDIVGEAAIIVWFGDRGVLPASGYEALPIIRRMAEHARGRVTRVLVRTAQDFLEAGFDEPLRWLEDIAQAAEADIHALFEILANQGPLTTAMVRFQTGLVQRVADHLRRPDAKYPLGAVLAALGDALGHLGRHSEAAIATEQAVDIFRGFIQTKPDVYSCRNLAMSLRAHAQHLVRLNRQRDALTAAQEATEIYRRLAMAHPAAFLSDIAGSLNVLAVAFTNLRRDDEALAAVREAIEIRRQLAQTRPDEILPGLGGSLNNFSRYLLGLGRADEALVASREALEIYRGLAQTRPDPFLAGVAMTLTNFGNALARTGQPEQSLAALQEAVGIYRRLAGRNPEAIRPELATGILCLGAALARAGRHEEAVTAIQEAVEIRRVLAQSSPDAFMGALAEGAVALGQALIASGRYHDAMAVTSDGLTEITPLVEKDPQALGGLVLELNRVHAAARDKTDLLNG